MIVHDRKYEGGRRYIAATERADLSIPLILCNMPTDWIREKPSHMHGTLYYMILWGDVAKQFTRREF